MRSAQNLTRYAWLSIATGVVVFALKLVAWAITGSVGLLSDAMESTVNIVAAVVALVALTIASRPPDPTHHFGHGKAEFFSALVEGLMIFVAATLIVIVAVERILNPRPLEDLGAGLAISVVASILNWAVAVVLIRAGRTHRSITLEADGKHLMTDVWTSVGVVAGIAAVWLTGWDVLDPLIALVVGLNIVVTGARLIWRSTSGLMDRALPEDDHETIAAVLRRYEGDDVTFHALQTRESGQHRFVSMHVLVPGAWTVQRGHDLVESLEADLREALPGAEVHTHVEPLEDPRSWEDQHEGQYRVDF